MDKNMKILIVDDFSTMRRIIKNLLRDLGFTNTDEADDGNTALPMLQSGKYDFLVTDWNMPGMTGIELLKAVRNDSNLVNLPVLMVTGHGDSESEVSTKPGGAYDLLIKPINLSVLISTMMEAIQAHERQQ